MRNTIIAGVAALSMAITPAPAVAQSHDNQSFQHEDLATALFALIALGVIGKSLANNNRDEVVDREYSRDRDLPGAISPGRNHGGLADGRGRDWWRDGSREHDRRIGTPGNPGRDRSVTAHGQALPASCIREVHAPGGLQRMLSRRCLENRAVRLNRLPDGCAMQVNTNHRTRHGYSARCLERRGYRIDYRR